MNRVLPSAVLGLSLLCGSSGSPDYDNPSPALPPEIISTADRQHETEVFEDVRQYWLQQGIGGVAATSLVILSGSDTFTCSRSADSQQELTALASSQYCPEENIVVATALNINTMNWLGHGAAVNTYTIAHEFGHAIQDARGALDDSLDTPGSRAAMELEATELAGEYMGNRYDDAVIDQVADTLSAVPADGHHGTATEQAAAFLDGVRATR